MLYLKEKRMKKNNGKLSQKCESSMEGNPPPVDIHAVFYVAIDSTSLSFYWLLNIKKYQNGLYVIYSNDLPPASRIHIKPSPFFLVFHFHSSSVHLFIIKKSLIQIVTSCYRLSFHTPICSKPQHLKLLKEYLHGDCKRSGSHSIFSMPCSAEVR